MSDCIFCDIAAGIAPAQGLIEYPGHESAAFRPLNPVVPGHMLVVPIEHVAHAADDPWAAGQVMSAAAEYVHEHCASANIITSINEAATQTVYHLHLHVIPRRFGDGVKLPWSDSEERTMKEAKP